MTFSATEAAFEGFRVVRRHPLAIVFWALAYVIFFTAFFGLFAGPLATVLATTESLEGTQPSPQEIQALMQSWSGFMVLALPLSLVLGAVLNAAVARSVLRPAEKGFGYMRLGADELRVLAVSLLLGIVFFAGTVLLFTIVGVAAGVAGQVNAGVGILVGVLLGLGATALLIWLAVRLSLAVPTTFHEKRISPFASFGLTKGHALPLLGMAVIAFIMSMLVGILATIVALPVTMATGGLEQLAALDGQSTAQILQTAGVGLLAWGAINAIFSALQLAVIYAPFSAAYRDLKGLLHE
jgi:MFS family permease